MLPVSLTMKGFGSFRDEAKVDFSDVEYFALVGPTGSGKSTVIDAMTFALYGSVPRWRDMKAVALALAPSVDRANVKLVFEVDSKRYVVARDVRRHPSGQITTKEARLDRLTDRFGSGGQGDDVVSLATGPRDVSERVEQLLGMNFDNFTKCVVLPQGQFAEFLSVDPRKRREILSNLLGFDFYKQMMGLANSRAANARFQAEGLNDQLQSVRLAEASPTAVSDAEGRVETLIALRTQMRVTLVQLTAAKKEHSQLANASQEAAGHLKALSAIREPEGLAGLSESLKEAERALKEADLAYKKATEEFYAADDAYDQSEDAGPLQDALQARRLITDWQDKIKGWAKRLKAALEELNENAKRQQLASLRKELESAESACDLLKVVEPPPSLERQATLVLERGKAEAALANARQVLAEAEQKHTAEALRSHLHPGDQCPVCLQPVKSVPKASAAVNLDLLTETVEKAGDSLEQAEKREAEVTSEVNRAFSRLRDPLVVFGAPESAGDVTSSDWTKFVTWAREQSRFFERSAKELSGRVKASKADTGLLPEDLKSPEERIQELRTRERELEQLIAGLNASIDGAGTEIVKTEPQAMGGLSEEVIRDRLDGIETLKGKREKALEDMKEKARRLEDARERKREVDDIASGLLTRLQEARSSVAELTPPIEGPSPIEGWLYLIDWRDTKTVTLTDEQRALKLSLDASRDEVDKRTREVESRLLEAGMKFKAGEDLVGSVPVLVATEVNNAESLVKDLHLRVRERAALEGRRDQKKDEETVAKFLANHLRSDRFQDWIIGSAFDVIVAEASKTLLTLTGDQFSLKAEDGEFFVIDHTDADLTRSVKTLSGGETFQASLALALALSNQITAMNASGGVRLDSIILDEGFGTLDDSTLDQVAATLENLANDGNRMVGIVTHVSALAERVPVQFQVRRSQQSSTIERVEA